ncbi:hypothetical protein NQ314_013645 [Rhamnusium bicolor]|uniref:DNA polymerase III delta N-terminal domain-containing protein n=1 Tax=Rhamnusium bicolor TaxID=1586634 RepID=A0AAV8X5H5_9CUCU|nr:hypothetical protein NQ314_013645 [Rhamnusium bicolor]
MKKTEVLKKSENVPEEIIKDIEDQLPRLFLIYGDDHIRARMLVEHLDKKFSKNNWQVVVNPGDEFYVATKKYVLIKVVNLKFLIFSMP